MLALLTALAGAQVGAPLLEPSTKWSVAIADQQCVLSRAFGTKAAKVTFGYELQPGAARAQIFIIEPSRDIEAMRWTSTEFDFGPDQERLIADGEVTPWNEGSRITRISADPARLERFRGAERITVKVDGQSYHLQLSGSAAAFVAAESCQADLVQSWGLDPKLVTEVATPAQPIRMIAALFGPDDYPREARRAGEQGMAVVRLEIDAQGAVTGCAIVQSSGSETLDNRTCAVLSAKARFRPARDMEGKTVPSISVQRIRWSR